MADEKLEQIVDKLITLVEKSEELDDQRKQRLLQIMSRVDEVLDPQKDTADDEPDNVIEWITDELEEFGSSHPTLTAYLERIMEGLVRFGV